MSTQNEASTLQAPAANGPLFRAFQPLREIFARRPVQLAAFCAGLGYLTWLVLKLKFVVLDLDTYWHLAVGDWIVQHGTVPHTGILSRTAADLPWIAYSWGSEVLLSRAYVLFGLVGIGAFGSGLTFLVALALFWSLHRLSRSFWMALLLWLSCFGALFTMAPRPVFFSMALFVVVLTFVMEAERSGNVKGLWWMPILFCIWANLHIQFIYGLFLLGLMLAPPVLYGAAQLNGKTRQWADNYCLPPRLSFPHTAALTAACTVATCIGPYTYHLYNVVLNYGRAKLTYSTIRELQPVAYTHAAEYIPLFVTAFAFYALGRQKRISIYQGLLLVIATLVSVRTVRDTWFINFTAAILIAEGFGVSHAHQKRERIPVPQFWMETASVGVVWVIMIGIFAQATDFNQRGLNRAISTDFPVGACNYIRRTMPPGPMYNSFDWGGFLTWYLPMYPVAADGRNDLYDGPLGDAVLHTEVDAYYYRKNPYFRESGFILVDAKGMLAQQLAVDGGYTRVYGDGIAEIYVPAAR